MENQESVTKKDGFESEEVTVLTSETKPKEPVLDGASGNEDDSGNKNGANDGNSGQASQLEAVMAGVLATIIVVAAIFITANIMFAPKPARTCIPYSDGQTLLIEGLKPLAKIQALSGSEPTMTEDPDAEDAEVTDAEDMNDAVETAGDETLELPDPVGTDTIDSEITDEQLYAVLGYHPNSKNPEDWEWDYYECMVDDIWDFDDYRQFYDIWLEVAQNPKTSTELLHYIVGRCVYSGVDDTGGLSDHQAFKLADAILSHENCDWVCISDLSFCDADGVRKLIAVSSPDVEDRYASVTGGPEAKNTWGQLYAVLGFLPYNKSLGEWFYDAKHASDVWLDNDYELFYDTWLDVALSPETSTEVLAYVAHRCSYSTREGDDFPSDDAVRLADAILRHKNCNEECISYLSKCKDDKVKEMVKKAS